MVSLIFNGPNRPNLLKASANGFQHSGIGFVLGIHSKHHSETDHRFLQTESHLFKDSPALDPWIQEENGSAFGSCDNYRLIQSIKINIQSPWCLLISHFFSIHQSSIKQAHTRSGRSGPFTLKRDESLDTFDGLDPTPLGDK